MSRMLRHLRPLLISGVVLILSAGIAFAAKPPTVGQGHTTGTEAAGKTIPVGQGDATGDTHDTTSDTHDTTKPASDTSEATESGDSGSHCLVDPTTATPQVLATLNHGAIVCWAAHQPTPGTFKNHGAFVSSWAHKASGSSPTSKGASTAAKHKGSHTDAP